LGPTTDFSLTARPTTDGTLDFEDLVVYALQFDIVSAPQAAVRPDHGSVAAADQLRLDAPARVAPGTPVTVGVWLTGSGRVHAAPLVLDWDSAVVFPVSAAPGTLVSDLGGVLLSAAPGTADVALLGATGGGFAGEGQLATFTFEVLAAGNPAVVLRPASGRDGQYRPGELSVARPATQVPLQTALSLPAPNPFRDRAMLELALARASR
jgi:hypothetical protein